MCFVGGCFPVQHNVVFEALFHQKLKRKIEHDEKVKFNFNIIRYERFRTLTEKIQVLVRTKKLDTLVFHVRPEPFLRLVKLYYKYLNNEGRVEHSLILPCLNLLNPEKYDMLDLRGMYRAGVKKEIPDCINFSSAAIIFSEVQWGISAML